MAKYTGRLYYEDAETGERRLMTDFEVEAETLAQATKLVLDQYWDARLDSACCTPTIKWNVPEEGEEDACPEPNG